MGWRRLIALIAWLLLGVAAYAQGGENVPLTVHDGGDGRLVARFAMQNLSFDTLGDRYVRLAADGMTCTASREGLPMLPTASVLVAMPRGTALTIGEVRLPDMETTHSIAPNTGSGARNRLVEPCQGATVKDAEAKWVGPDSRVYGSDVWYRGGDVASLEHVGTMGRQEIYRLTVRPLAYNPKSMQTRIYSSLTVTLEASAPKYTAADMQSAERYLIVSRPQFREGLQPFVQWKRQEGYVVDELYADTNRRDAVKALVATRFGDNMQWPSYILIVGDAPQIQSFLGTTRPTGLDNHTTDLYYAEHTGDYLPDALLGRWPVNDTAELRAVVEKTLHYEQCTGLDTQQLRRAVLVAGAENSSPAPLTTNGQVNYLSRRLQATHPTVDTLCYHNPASGGQRAEILGDIAAGASFLNYTAHCSVGGWSNPSVGFAAIDTLGQSQPMLYVNNCCKSNAFDGTGFGEQLLRKAQGGAIGVIGATNSTLWNEDYYWAVGPKYPFSLEPAYDSLHQGAFDMWLGDSVQTQGQLLAAGNMAVTASGSPYDKFYWEIYCLLGDPSLRPYMGAPRRIFLSVPDTLTVGATSVRVSGTPGAIVSIVQGQHLLGCAVLDGHRSMDIVLGQPLDTLPVVVTASGPQMVPVVDTAATALPTGRAVTFRNVTVTDTTVDFTLVNLGADTLRDITVQLLCDDASPALFDAVPAFADTLLPRAEATMHLSLSVLQWERRWSGGLYAYSVPDSVVCQPLHLQGRLDGVPPSLSFLLTDADSNTTMPIAPATTYSLIAAAAGLADSMGITVTAMPTGDTLARLGTTLPDGNGQLPILNASLVTPDTITHLHIVATVTHGNYSHDYSLWLTAGRRLDGFEEGTASHPWQLGTMHPWIVDTTVCHSGSRSLRSAPIDYRQTSDLSIDVLLPSADSISFWAKASSEQSYDKLLFHVDGVFQMELSGNAGWRRCAFPLDAGSHTLRWRYVKDESDDYGRDCAWIDDVQMPLALWDDACGWFGTTQDPVAIDGPEAADGSMHLSVHPCPASTSVTIDGATRIALLDMQGRTLLTAQGDNIDLAHLPAGTYIAAVEVAGTIVYTKLIKR